MHEFHPDDQYAIVSEHLTGAHVQGAFLSTEPDGSYSLKLFVPVPGTDRFMEFTASMEPFLAATMRTIAYAGASQADIELHLKGVLRKQADKTLYTMQIVGGSCPDA